MSLDVYLYGKSTEETCHCACCGNEHTTMKREELYQDNITHNLGEMAREAGIYMHLWRPEEIGIYKADQLIEPLAAGLVLLLSDPVRFKAFDPPNKRGSYAGLVKFVANYLAACRERPEATVEAYR